MAQLELWRVPVGRPESEWSRLSAADLDTTRSNDATAEASKGCEELRKGEGLGDIEDCPWHMSAPAHWEMYEYLLANAGPDV